MNDVYFLRSISTGKQNRRKPWPTTELSPKLAFPGIECQIIISVKDSYDISGSKIPLHTCHSRRLGYAHAPIYLQLQQQSLFLWWTSVHKYRGFIWMQVSGWYKLQQIFTTLLWWVLSQHICSRDLTIEVFPPTENVKKSRDHCLVIRLAVWGSRLYSWPLSRGKRITAMFSAP